jgi:glucose-1-phosphatase
MTFDPAQHDAVLFDLGGVILELDYGRTMAEFSKLLGRDATHLYRETAQNPLFDQFERGEISAPEFRDALRALLGAPNISAAALDQAWNGIIGEFPRVHLDLLRELRGQTRTLLLSNTNEIHLEYFIREFSRVWGAEFGHFDELFEVAYYSHQVGMRKPEARVFEHVLRQHGLAPERVLFLDDNHHNVAAARALGIDARLHERNAPLAPYFGSLAHRTAP